MIWFLSDAALWTVTPDLVPHSDHNPSLLETKQAVSQSVINEAALPPWRSAADEWVKKHRAGETGGRGGGGRGGGGERAVGGRNK